MNLFGSIHLSDGRRRKSTNYQSVYSSQLYGTFFSIFGKFQTKSDNENYYLYRATFKLINYKGIINMGITRIDEPYLRVTNSGTTHYDIQLEVKALHDNDKVTLNFNTPLIIPKKNSFMNIDRKLIQMHHPKKSALENNIFDEEFYYREGVKSNLEVSDTQRKPRHQLWDNAFAGIQGDSKKCPRSKLMIR